MATNTSIILSNLDVDTHKNTLAAYLKSQDRFKDYDFDGSNMSVLLEILSLNTFHNAFYLNMIGNEMFLDTAQIRDSVVSHAKELNYTPRSFTSAVANVSIVFTVVGEPNRRSIVIPKGQAFTSRFGSKIYTFTTGENIVVTDFVSNTQNDTLIFTGSDISLYEGYYITDTFTYSAQNPQRLLISNKNVDTSSISVTVIEDVGASALEYRKATSLFDIDETSRVFFIQGAENNSYEIVFGDGVSGRAPKDNSIITVEYRISNGELPNGCNAFTPDSNIDGITYSNIRVQTGSPAAGGSVSESIESIKYNAPRHFTTQERAVTTEDYENLLKLNFPEINTVTAFGGEDLDPPQFGRVFVAVDLKEVDGLPEAKKDQYYRFLKPRSPVSIDPVFVNPEYTYIAVNASVNYNVNITRLTSDDIRMIVSSAVLAYAGSNLNNFNRTLRYSKLVQSIDSSQQSIISNETSIRIVKVLKPVLGIASTFDVNFNVALDKGPASVVGGYALQTTQFTYEGQNAVMRDNGLGVIEIISATSLQPITTIGTINYESGLVQLSNIIIDAYEGNGIKFYGVPKNKDVSTVNNVILNIIEEDISVTVVPVRA